MRSLARSPLIIVASVEPFASIAIPMRSLPSPPVVETLATCLASCTIAPGAVVVVPGLPEVASRTVFASTTSCTSNALTTVNAVAQSGPPVAVAVRTPYTSVGPGVCWKAIAMAADSGGSGGDGVVVVLAGAGKAFAASAGLVNGVAMFGPTVGAEP